GSGTMSRPGNFAIRAEFEFQNGPAVSGWYAFEIRAQPDYTFSVVREKCSIGMGGSHYSFDRQGESFQTNVKGLQPALGTEALALPIIGGSQEFAPVVR